MTESPWTNQWIASAVAEKVGVMETAAEFFKKPQAIRPATGSWGFFTTQPMFLLSLKILGHPDLHNCKLGLSAR
jgi:hypothetical protein